CVLALAALSILVALGGMNVVGYTSAIQVLFLVISGFIGLYITLDLVSGGEGMFKGFGILTNEIPQHFEMVFDKTNPNFIDLPGLSVLLGGMWIANLNYWGCNQYITQRALGADLKTARKGILFAGFLKLLMPIIVMLPGIAAYVLYKNGALQEEMAPGGIFHADNTYSAICPMI